MADVRPVPDITGSTPGFSSGEILAFVALWFARLSVVHEIAAFRDPAVNTQICQALARDHWAQPSAFAEAAALLANAVDEHPEAHGILPHAERFIEVAHAWSKEIEAAGGQSEEIRFLAELAETWATKPAPWDDNGDPT